MKKMLIALMWAMMTAVTAPSVVAFDFTDAEQKVVPLELAPIQNWALALIEPNDTLSKFCVQFTKMAKLGRRDDVPNCIGTIGKVNRFTNEAQLHILPQGKRMWLPTNENDFRHIRTRIVRSGFSKTFGVDVDTLAEVLGIDKLMEEQQKQGVRLSATESRLTIVEDVSSTTQAVTDMLGNRVTKLSEKSAEQADQINLLKVELERLKKEILPQEQVFFFTE